MSWVPRSSEVRAALPRQSHQIGKFASMVVRHDPKVGWDPASISEQEQVRAQRER